MGADHRPACAWFLKIVSVQTFVYACVCLCVCVCVSAPEAINSWWHDMDPKQLVKQVLQLLYGNCSRYCYWAWPLELVCVIGTNPITVS